MGRNIERDEKEAAKRKDAIIQAGFHLFSQNSIETVSIQAVSDAADVGVATIYKYFQTKVNLTIAISAWIWTTFLHECEKEVSPEARAQLNACDLMEYYTDMIIKLYLERPDILRFSSNFKTFINRNGAMSEQLQAHLAPLLPLRKNFHDQYEAARQNHCIRTDVSEDDMYTTVSVTMLSMAERYAQGIVWADKPTPQYKPELIYLKEMLLDWMTKTPAPKGGNAVD